MLTFLFLACNEPNAPSNGVASIPDPVADANIYVSKLGDPVPWLRGEMLTRFWSGRDVIDHTFMSNSGLGPSFNADSCASCHQAPFSGGSAPRYRDLWLVKTERWDGALENAGTNGLSPVRNLYDLDSTHIPESDEVVLYARRNTPPGFGVGLFAFISDNEILSNADPLDEDGDGISGEANFEQGLIGRFGYKAQAATLESFNRGAMFNQMGITSDPLFYTFPESPLGTGSTKGLFDVLMPSAHAQVSAPDEPTTDDDGIPDPEISNEDQLDLLIYSTYIGVLPPKQTLNTSETKGAELFEDIGCASCHIPTLDSTIGPIRAYTDLLVHDMGEGLADGIAVGFATGSEFRTQPLWNLVLHRPFLHDGRAQTIHEAIEWHGGEGTASRDQYLALDDDDKANLRQFLLALGGKEPNGQTMAVGSVPEIGALGGPVAGLNESEMDRFELGYRMFDQNHSRDKGLNDHFNADSCRACHRDPVQGGAGGADVSVIRYGQRDMETGTFTPLEESILYRSAYWSVLPQRLPSDANILESRNPPSLLGLGYLDILDDEIIMANADPDDSDGDGISGRYRVLEDGRLGRFGWKANVPSLSDFVADASLVEIGLTIPSEFSTFSSEDDGDAISDPEQNEDYFYAIEQYLIGLEAPQPTAVAEGNAGKQIFAEVGCADCHLLSLGGVAAYTDLLLHDIAPDPMVLVELDEGVMATEYRTPPLWGIVETAPYLHDGSAATLSLAITDGHFGEGTSSREAFASLSEADKQALIEFLSSL